MKKFILTMVAILSMTTMMAQTNNGERKTMKKMSHEEMTTQMTSKLNLNNTQKAKVAALNKEYQDYLMPEPPQRPEDGKISGTKDSNSTKKPAMKKTGSKPGNSQNQAKRQEYEKELKKILSDDQYQNYQKMQPQHKGNGPKGKMSGTQKSKE